MSSHEFAEWLAFFRVQPYGEWREDFRNASLMALIANVMTRSKESDPVRTAEDFMPDFEKALDELEDEMPEHERLWNKVRGAFGGLVTTPLSATPLSPGTATSPQIEEHNLGGEEITSPPTPLLKERGDGAE